MAFTAEELVEKAIDQRQRGRFEEALVSASLASELDSENANAWWQVALNLLSLGNEEKALPALEMMLELSPYFALGWTRYGATLLKTGDEESAQDAFETAIDEDSEQKEALEALADIYSRKNKDKKESDDQELSVLTKLDEIGNLSSFQINRLGILHYQKQSFFSAIKYWERSNDSASLFNIGLVYNRTEISQNADAIDTFRLTLKQNPNYLKAKEWEGRVLPSLLIKAKEAATQESTLSPSNQWYINYINPFELLNFSNDLEPDVKIIQRQKKVLLSEIDLEDGRISWMSDIHVDKSKAIFICEELNNEKKFKYHWHIFQQKPLLNFLSKGCHEHFLVYEIDSPLETIELLKNRDIDFREWLSDIFSKQFDLILLKAIEQSNFTILKCLFDGRRWVIPAHNDKCFESARRRIDRLIDPLRKAKESADDVMPTDESVTQLLKKDDLIIILSLLPTIYFRDPQNEVTSIVRYLAVSSYNPHGNIDLSKKILQVAKNFRFNSTELQHLIDEDLTKIEGIIYEERKNEIKLSKDNARWEITKEGVLKGDLFFPVDSIVSVRWGAIITREKGKEAHSYVFAVKNSTNDEILFHWIATKDFEKSKEYFDGYMEAAYAYFVSIILEKLELNIKAKGAVKIGTCIITDQHIEFKTKGLIFSKKQIIPWAQVQLRFENGEVIISDSISKKITTRMSLLSIENAPMLHLLTAHFKSQIKGENHGK